MASLKTMGIEPTKEIMSQASEIWKMLDDLSVKDKTVN